MSRKIDALIAEHIFGLVVTGEGLITQPDDDREYLLPYYSSDIDSAWGIVERLHTAGVRIDTGIDGRDNRYRVKIETKNVMARAKTAPMAICLAALKARGIEV